VLPLLIHPLGEPDAQGLQYPGSRADRDHVVDELDSQAGSQGADVPDCASHRFEGGPRFVEERRVASHHDRESTQLRHYGAAAHRGVQQTDPRGARRLAELAGCRWQNRGHADDRAGTLPEK
jgi:hypothetical protein